MSAQWRDLSDAASPGFARMGVEDLDEVMAIETDIYAFPWSRRNFKDSIDAGYLAWTLRGPEGLLGYAVVMPAVDEAHLLNISVARAHQGRGAGRLLMDHAVTQAMACGATSLLLEVRPSNARALSFYERYGFRRIGVRRGYYPAGEAFPSGREDALVMRLDWSADDGNA